MISAVFNGPHNMKLFLAVLLTSPLLLSAACGNETGPAPAIVGTYYVVSANGQTLPATLIRSGSDTVSFVQGSLVATQGGTFSMLGLVRPVNATGYFTDTVQTSGRYFGNGSGFILVDTNGTGIGLLSLVGDTLAALVASTHYIMVRTAR